MSVGPKAAGVLWLPGLHHQSSSKTHADQCLRYEGNIMVDEKYLGSAGDVAVSGPDSRIIQRWTAWCKVVRKHDCRMIAQLSVTSDSAQLMGWKRLRGS